MKAWRGADRRWVAIDRDGVSVSEVKAANFATANDAAVYADSVAFEIEQG